MYVHGEICNCPPLLFFFFLTLRLCCLLLLLSLYISSPIHKCVCFPLTLPHSHRQWVQLVYKTKRPTSSADVAANVTVSAFVYPTMRPSHPLCVCVCVCVSTSGVNKLGISCNLLIYKINKVRIQGVITHNINLLDLSNLPVMLRKM